MKRRKKLRQLIRNVSVVGVLLMVYASIIAGILLYQLSQLETLHVQVRRDFEKINDVLAGRSQPSTVLPLATKYNYPSEKLSELLSGSGGAPQFDQLLRAELRNLVQSMRNYELDRIQSQRKLMTRLYAFFVVGLALLISLTFRLTFHGVNLVERVANKVVTLAKSVYLSVPEFDEPVFDEELEIHEVAKEISYVEVLHNILRYTPLDTTVEDFVNSAGMYVCILFEAEKFSVLLIDWETESLTIEGVFSTEARESSSVCTGRRFNLRGTLFGRLLEARERAVVINGLETETRGAQLPFLRLLFEEGFRSVMVCESNVGTQPLGFFVLGSTKRGAFTERDLQTFVGLSKSLSLRLNYSLVTQRLLSHLGSGLVSLAEFRDTETGNHLKRVSLYSKIVAQELNLPPKMVREISEFAPLHDIGKVSIPDAILLKPGKLDSKEWEVMKTHVRAGVVAIERFMKEAANLLATSTLQTIQNIVADHHERWDGKGYPLGKKGNEISIEGRVVAITDVFDALTSNRPYKGPVSFDEAMEIIRSESGRQFDPDVADAFLRRLDDIRKVYETFRD